METPVQTLNPLRRVKVKIQRYWGFLFKLNFCGPQNTVTQNIPGTVKAIERGQMIVVVDPLSILALNQGLACVPPQPPRMETPG